jgi:ribonuclease Z
LIGFVIMSIVTPGGFRIEGCWTKAGIGSCVHVRGKRKGCDILFDCGVYDDSIETASYIFISHSHTDHIGAIISHARARALQRKPAKYYVPHFAFAHLETARKAFSELDGCDIPMEIIAVAPGDTILCDGNFKVVVFGTDHRVPSQGYALYASAAKVLKAEYAGKTTDDIRSMIISGVEVHEERPETLDIVYTGDTLMKGLLTEANRFIFNAAILIVELTYLDGPYEKAIEWGHIHINDIVEHEHLFDAVSQVILVHISVRYAPHSKALSMIHQSLPEPLLRKSMVSLKSFGASEYLSSPLHLRRDEVGWGWGRPQHSQGEQRHNGGRNSHHPVESRGGSSWSDIVGGRGGGQQQQQRGRSSYRGSGRGRYSDHGRGRGRDYRDATS